MRAADKPRISSAETWSTRARAASKPAVPHPAPRFWQIMSGNQAAGLTPPMYTDGGELNGLVIRAAHINQLRDAIKAAPSREPGLEEERAGRMMTMSRGMQQVMLAFAALLALAGSARAQAAVEYYQQDALGSVRVVTGPSGDVIRRHDYLPFGVEHGSAEAQPCQATGNDAQRFTGKVRDWESCLDYFEARYYRSSIGRFTTVDPYLDQGRAFVDPQRWNRYAYGLNNPLRNVDPDGRDTIDLVIGFGQGLGNAAASVVTGFFALATNPRGVGSAIAADVQLLGQGLANPSHVLNAYVSLATSTNDADQRALGAAIGHGAAFAALVLSPTMKTVSTQTAGVSRGLGGNPFKGRAPQEIADMLTNKGYVGRGPDPIAGKGTFLNPQTGRSVHIDANHPAPKPPHVSVQRPRDARTLPPREYPLR